MNTLAVALIAFMCRASPRTRAAAIATLCAAAHLAIPRHVPHDVLGSTNAQAFDEAAIAIDASKVENRISPHLYGQFAEFMFENIKCGLHAELLRNRGFEETANASTHGRPSRS